jgi:hypothetical protein
MSVPYPFFPLTKWIKSSVLLVWKDLDVGVQRHGDIGVTQVVQCALGLYACLE